MKDMDNILDEALGILDPVEKAIKESEKTPPKIRPSRPISVDDIDNDYKYQRENLYNLIERGQDAIDGILELAKESEHPRTYEVALNGIKQVADVTDKLVELQEKMKRLKEVPNNAPSKVTNALFVGSTAELQKMLKDKSDV
jgi:hypothetical protein|tara:strand:+ start:252 stop:677 length:426 start_codon:yes stop_codon:yes gene_type:complete